MGEDFITRLQIEHDELNVKVDKLKEFINSGKIVNVTTTQQILLINQYSSMVQYLNILELRLKDLNGGK